MAGDGKRFSERGYKIAKPFIEVNGKSILFRTLDSLPQIRNKKYDTLTFAIRSEHDVYRETIKNYYGDDVNFVVFEKTTRGNLETAIKSLDYIKNDKPIIILDADNQYDGSDVIDYFQEKHNISHQFAGICYFSRIDDSIKWGFAITKDDKVLEVIEKDYSAIEKNGSPMVGVFYFSSPSLFIKHADRILRNKIFDKNEFYMTQSIKSIIQSGIPVYGLKVNNVIPLGTPEDIERIINEEP